MKRTREGMSPAVSSPRAVVFEVRPRAAALNGLVGADGCYRYQASSVCQKAKIWVVPRNVRKAFVPFIRG